LLKITRLLVTVSYLRPIQIFGRFWFNWYRPAPDLSPAPRLRPMSGQWVEPAYKRPSLLGPQKFRFLNVEHELTSADDWNSSSYNMLWLYNLHYFDDLNANGAASRSEWHRELLLRWVKENPPAEGVGWAPYPTSLRIVNWIKWSLAGNRLPDECLQSLAVQARWLGQRLEYHLLGNHLFANAKALVFAGLFFEGDEAQRWLQKGLEILKNEIPEQILTDGGHFERSPMYQALVYEDMLDLYNLTLAYQVACSQYRRNTASWSDVIERMGRWLAAMCHPDGEVAFFNDSVMGIAPLPSRLFDYAGRLGYTSLVRMPGTVWLKESGYVRVESGEAVLLADVAPIGPDYLPGHAHADTLSYELSIAGKRVIVNSGTSRYGSDEERERQRSTAAHNTLEIDGKDSSEVWSGFRVARRARPFDVSVKETDNSVIIGGAHDGYTRLTGRPVHRRYWKMNQHSLEVRDSVEGEFSQAVSRIHFHPAMVVQQDNTAGIISWQGKQIYWQSECTQATIESASWHPEFGVSMINRCLALHLDSTPERSACRFQLRWN